MSARASSTPRRNAARDAALSAPSQMQFGVTVYWIVRQSVE
jgi:hypothetical protein